MPGNGDQAVEARRAEAARLVSEGCAAADRGDGDRTIELLTAALGVVRELVVDFGHDTDLHEGRTGRLRGGRRALRRLAARAVRLTAPSSAGAVSTLGVRRWRHRPSNSR
jgi:hypothetical protein